jgi:hypothetical protein
MKRICACLLFVLALSAPVALQGQSTPCDDGATGCTAWSTTTTPFTVALAAPDCQATLYMYTRVCNGVTEYYMSHYTVSYGCGSFDPALAYYHRNRNGLVEYLLGGFISQHVSTPSCPPSQPVPVVNIFAASCGIWVCCTYELPDNPVVTCDNGWDGPPPHTNTTPKTVTSCKWQSCGTQCCRRTYSVCRRSSPTGGWYTDIQFVSKTPIGDCSGAATFSPKPCETDCQ